MKKTILSLSIVISGILSSQVGINENNPSATLDIKSKGNTSATKALEINNSDAKELVTVLDNGNVGINVPTPTAKLHTDGGVRYENLPQISTGITPIAIDANGYVGTYVPSVLYSYLTIDNTQAVDSFPLASNTSFTLLPFLTSGIQNNPLGVSIGTDTNSMLTRTNGTNIMGVNARYITIPIPGVYKINLNYYTSCSGNRTGNSGGVNLLGIGTGIYKANSGSTNYSELTTIRYNALPRRTDAGALATGYYNYPFAHNIFSIVETTTANEKVAFFVNWGTGDQYSGDSCTFPAPAGLDKRVTLIISKL
ncbi:hypothetical protein [Chryseobacterium binzhouense]|uniref:hypothetical protein n=1 Tax=Chryseobacterium binzhouense TaxID=2593646 RepID=UPI00117CC30A|nr:hypothetical protein [Chryseobacterium binzhouense]